MGITTRVKGDMAEKKPFNFALFWDKYGTFFILAIIVAIFGTLSSEYFLTTNNITQIFVQSSVTVLIGIPVPVIFSLIVAVILWFLTTRMRLGRNIYALGGNKNSAFYSGIDVKFHILVVFIISGVCAGLAGVVSTARLGAAEPLAGMGFETYAIASAIIGGTSFFGGKGRIFSVVIGGLIIGTINNGLNILQVQTYYQLVVMGGLIIAAVALDRLISK